MAQRARADPVSGAHSTPPGRHRAPRPSRHRGTLAVVVSAATAVSAGLLVTILEHDPVVVDGRTTAVVARDPAPAPSATASPNPLPTAPQRAEDALPARSQQARDRQRARRPDQDRVPVVVPEAGEGSFSTAPQRPTSGQPLGPTGSERITTYAVQVEDGLPFTTRAVARTVDQTLTDRRGWSTEGHQLLRRTDPATSDVRVVLASPDTADSLCAPLLTGGRLSCRNGRDVVINAWRWAHGAPSYGDDLDGYRAYVINHEVGHALGYAHRACPSAGARAPVMVQQTKGLDGCRANPWPSRE